MASESTAAFERLNQTCSRLFGDAAASYETSGGMAVPVALVFTDPDQMESAEAGVYRIGFVPLSDLKASAITPAKGDQVRVPDDVGGETVYTVVDVDVDAEKGVHLTLQRRAA